MTNRWMCGAWELFCIFGNDNLFFIKRSIIEINCISTIIFFPYSLSGTPPFTSSDTQQLTEQILNGQYSFSSRQWGRVTRKALNLVRRMLTVNPRNRISIEDILNHDWLKVGREC